jgi:biopolymer transport protein ExbB
LDEVSVVMKVLFQGKSQIWMVAVLALMAGLALQPPAIAQAPQANPPAVTPATLPNTPQVPAVAPAASVPAQSAPATPEPAMAPAPPVTAQPAATEPGISLTLPRDLTPWGMFMAADIVVKAVMVGLASASLLTWTIWFAKAIELLAARRRLRQSIAALAEARSLADAMARQPGDVGVAGMLRAAEAELRLSAGAIEPTGVKERVASRLERLEAAAGRRMIRGTALLATIGATAPFVGLFGTVWGIMNSFIGISKSHTTNLAVVAPGIAEALLATALGLVAAIPAVVMYNMFSRWIAGYRALYADAAAEILRLVSRDLDRDAFDRVNVRRATAAE